jgi:hypothetical protein
MNRVLLASGSVVLTTALGFFVLSRGHAGEAVPNRTPAPSPNQPTAGADADIVDPDDTTTYAELPDSWLKQASRQSELDKLLAKMNWCGTGGSGGATTTPIREAGVPNFELHPQDDEGLSRLLVDLKYVRVPSVRKKLVRAFLVERIPALRPVEAQELVLNLASAEPVLALQWRLARAAAALGSGTPWEAGFDRSPPIATPEPWRHR